MPASLAVKSFKNKTLRSEYEIICKQVQSYKIPEAYLNSDAAECMAITRFGYIICFVEADFRQQPCAVIFEQYLQFSGNGFTHYF